MTAKRLKTSVRWQNGLAVIDLHGEIDAQGEQASTAAYAQACTMNVKRVLLNFSDVNYIDSTGIAMLVGFIAHARKTKHKLMICELSTHYRKIFAVTRLSDFMMLVDDEQTALQA